MPLRLRGVHLFWYWFGNTWKINVGNLLSPPSFFVSLTASLFCLLLWLILLCIWGYNPLVHLTPILSMHWNYRHKTPWPDIHIWGWSQGPCACRQTFYQLHFNLSFRILFLVFKNSRFQFFATKSQRRFCWSQCHFPISRVCLFYVTVLWASSVLVNWHVGDLFLFFSTSE